MAIWSVLEGKADIGSVVGDPSLDLPTAKNENDRLVRDTHTEIDVEELMADHHRDQLRDVTSTRSEDNDSQAQE